MTILFFARLFYPHIGGVEKHVLEISKRFVKQSHKVTVITEQLSESHSAYKQSKSLSARHMGEIDGVKIIRINAGKNDWFKKFRIWKRLWKKRAYIKDADIVHCHDVFFWYLPFRFLYPTKKIFTTFHGYEGNKIPGKKAIAMHKISEVLSNGNICVGNFYKKWYGTKPTFVTYGAVDFKNIEKYKTEKKNNRNLNNKIIFFGRLENETGIMKYLEALKILKKKGIDLGLDIYGEGSLAEAVNKYKKENNLRIRTNEFILNIESVLNNYEYVFCSRYLSMLESMAFSKPVFAEYENPIKKDYLQMTPFSKYISISKDAAQIVENLENYLSGKKIADTQKAYEWVKAYTWENMVNMYLRLWQSS
ncbi:MAG: hypothetical protein CO135_02520 [Candidatus Levybacteria bacterium CG_4_9_14_3_um_filter_35_16]|nr:MAG: hypothetical protein COW87_04390 [Candidatus Levybacteria bacterium CG22_combo_CG10-13_8_21_14_all_35_11]PJA00041.1 MAG: hypothetical protein COX78_01070 [Candidatus Levybacteria bacterium CG_4_10_14_0_2_um_filter_35_8]PJA91222.1 MAG: hypothetical protein CO135_02520 [Candidatus Levybacteria bacterium CG_4_9_14_3_um_filter_35_16]PJC54846.1 MAG: hypothetical protein CO028_00120 [Candidatus Levybacteria bacterium CG_4_9_14_0_2_um_filter_35_21]